MQQQAVQRQQGLQMSPHPCLSQQDIRITHQTPAVPQSRSSDAGQRNGRHPELLSAAVECKALAPSVAWLAAEAWRAAGGCRYSTPALAAAMEQKALLLRFCCAEALHDAACCTQSLA